MPKSNGGARIKSARVGQDRRLSYNAWCMAMTFSEKLTAASAKNRSLLCVGLDPDPARMPAKSITDFNKAIIDATADLVCAYKPNFAFYEALGIEGIKQLKETIEYVPYDIPVIGDAKRGDIGSTAQAYARALFAAFGVDAATVNPYLGFDSIEPFLAHEDKGIFILCRTSNKGALDFQNILSEEGEPLYRAVARKTLEWNTQGNIGLVVGATYPNELQEIRSLCPDMPLLIPGIGTQGGDLELAVRNGVDWEGKNAIFNVSRQVIYASSGTDFAPAARKSAREIRDRIQEYLEQG